MKASKISLILLLMLVSLLALQGCSFMHRLILHNDTNENWHAAYQLRLPNGIFMDTVRFEKKDTKFNKDENSRFDFEILKNEKAILGYDSNTNYGWYKTLKTQDPQHPWFTFLNVDSILIYNEVDSFLIPTDHLEPFLKKDNLKKAIISIDRVQKLYSQHL